MLRRPDLCDSEAGAERFQSTCAAENQERESSDNPMLKAFWRVAPSVLLSFLAIRDADVFLRAIVFSSRTSLEVHERRFFFLLAIIPPFQESQLVSLTDVKEKLFGWMEITFETAEQVSHMRSWNSRQ